MNAAAPSPARELRLRPDGGARSPLRTREPGIGRRRRPTPSNPAPASGNVDLEPHREEGCTRRPGTLYATSSTSARRFSPPTRRAHDGVERHRRRGACGATSPRGPAERGILALVPGAPPAAGAAAQRQMSALLVEDAVKCAPTARSAARQFPDPASRHCAAAVTSARVSATPRPGTHCRGRRAAALHTGATCDAIANGEAKDLGLDRDRLAVLRRQIEAAFAAVGRAG